MAKIWLHIAFSILLLNSTLLYQLGKLPVLVQHFIEHNQRDKDLGFIDFLSMHYWGTDLNDNDQHRDNQLPFKQFDTNIQQALFTPALKSFALKPVVHFQKNEFPDLKNSSLPDPALAALFRPPKA